MEKLKSELIDNVNTILGDEYLEVIMSISFGNRINEYYISYIPTDTKIIGLKKQYSDREQCLSGIDDDLKVLEMALLRSIILGQETGPNSPVITFPDIKRMILYGK